MKTKERTRLQAVRLQSVEETKDVHGVQHRAERELECFSSQEEARGFWEKFKIVLISLTSGPPFPVVPLPQLGI